MTTPDLHVVDLDATDRALADIGRRIARDYPSIPPERITEVVRRRYDATRDAKVQTFRLVLAEREARVQMQRDLRDSSSGHQLSTAAGA